MTQNFLSDTSPPHRPKYQEGLVTWGSNDPRRGSFTLASLSLEFQKANFTDHSHLRDKESEVQSGLHLLKWGPTLNAEGLGVLHSLGGPYWMVGASGLSYDTRAA